MGVLFFRYPMRRIVCLVAGTDGQAQHRHGIGINIDHIEMKWINSYVQLQITLHEPPIEDGWRGYEHWNARKTAYPLNIRHHSFPRSYWISSSSFPCSWVLVPPFHGVRILDSVWSGLQVYAELTDFFELG